MRLELYSDLLETLGALRVAPASLPPAKTPITAYGWALAHNEGVVLHEDRGNRASDAGAHHWLHPDRAGRAVLDRQRHGADPHSHAARHHPRALALDAGDSRRRRGREPRLRRAGAGVGPDRPDPRPEPVPIAARFDALDHPGVAPAGRPGRHRPRR